MRHAVVSGAQRRPRESVRWVLHSGPERLVINRRARTRGVCTCRPIGSACLAIERWAVGAGKSRRPRGARGQSHDGECGQAADRVVCDQHLALCTAQGTPARTAANAVAQTASAVRIEIATAVAAVGESERSSQVIEALNSAASVPIPYRDSKLTRILQARPRSACMSAHRIPTVPCHAAPRGVMVVHTVQDSLGGGSKTVMVTTIAPAARLLSQVRFAVVASLARALHVSAVHRCFTGFGDPQRLKCAIVLFAPSAATVRCDAPRQASHCVADAHDAPICNEDTARRQPAGRSARDRAGECGLWSKAKGRRNRD